MAARFRFLGFRKSHSLSPEEVPAKESPRTEYVVLAGFLLLICGFVAALLHALNF